MLVNNKKRKLIECYYLKALDCPDVVTNNSSRRLGI